MIPCALISVWTKAVVLTHVYSFSLLFSIISMESTRGVDSEHQEQVNNGVDGELQEQVNVGGDGEGQEQVNTAAQSDSQVQQTPQNIGNGTEIIDLHEVDIQDESVHDEPRVDRLQNLKSISFHDITYKVKQRQRCKRISSKVILNSCR